MGIGRNSVIRKSIIDKNVRIGENVQVQEMMPGCRRACVLAPMTLPRRSDLRVCRCTRLSLPFAPGARVRPGCPAKGRVGRIGRHNVALCSLLLVTERKLSCTWLLYSVFRSSTTWRLTACCL